MNQLRVGAFSPGPISGLCVSRVLSTIYARDLVPVAYTGHRGRKATVERHSIRSTIFLYPGKRLFLFPAPGATVSICLQDAGIVYQEFDPLCGIRILISSAPPTFLEACVTKVTKKLASTLVLCFLPYSLLTGYALVVRLRLGLPGDFTS